MDSHEFQIIGTAFEDKLNYTGGLFYYEEDVEAVSYTHLRAHETVLDIVCRLLLEKKQQLRSYTPS